MRLVALFSMGYNLSNVAHTQNMPTFWIKVQGKASLAAAANSVRKSVY